MNTRKEKEKLQKYTIGYLIAMVVIFVVVLLGVSSPGLKTVALIVTVVVFVALIILQWRKANTPSSFEKTTSIPTEKNAPIPSVQETSKTAQKSVSELPKKEVATKKNKKEQATDIKTKTGSECTEPGEYHCSKHPHRTVVMEEGKRFPPCRGDKKGHSAIWVLEQSK